MGNTERVILCQSVISKSASHSLNYTNFMEYFWQNSTEQTLIGINNNELFVYRICFSASSRKSEINLSSSFSPNPTPNNILSSLSAIFTSTLGQPSALFPFFIFSDLFPTSTICPTSCPPDLSYCLH